MKDSLWSVDMFRCESILLSTHWVMIFMAPHTRRTIGFGIQANSMDGREVRRMFNRAISGSSPPKHLSCDHDPLFRCFQWKANLCFHEVEEIKTAPDVPISHPFDERLNGTIRREYLDQVFFWNAVDLERKLGEFKPYFNAHRTHIALNGETPSEKGGNAQTAIANIGDYR